MDNSHKRKRDEYEVKGYYVALKEIERFSLKKTKITETIIKKLHGLVLGKGNSRIKPTPYRDGQNVIRDSLSGGIVYLPPENFIIP